MSQEIAQEAQQQDPSPTLEDSTVIPLPLESQDQNTAHEDPKNDLSDKQTPKQEDTSETQEVEETQNLLEQDLNDDSHVKPDSEKSEGNAMPQHEDPKPELFVADEPAIEEDKKPITTETVVVEEDIKLALVVDKPIDGSIEINPVEVDPFHKNADTTPVTIEPVQENSKTNLAESHSQQNQEDQPKPEGGDQKPLIVETDSVHENIKPVIEEPKSELAKEETTQPIGELDSEVKDNLQSELQDQPCSGKETTDQNQLLTEPSQEIVSKQIDEKPESLTEAVHGDPKSTPQEDSKNLNLIKSDIISHSIEKNTIKESGLTLVDQEQVTQVQELANNILKSPVRQNQGATEVESNVLDSKPLIANQPDSNSESPVKPILQESIPTPAQIEPESKLTKHVDQNSKSESKSVVPEQKPVPAQPNPKPQAPNKNAQAKPKPAPTQAEIKTPAPAKPVQTDSKQVPDQPNTQVQAKTAPAKKPPTDSIVMTKEELLKWNERINTLKTEIKKKDDELVKQQKAFTYEKEGYIDRNKNLQNLLDSAKDKYEKQRKKAINLEFKNEELNKEIKKIEEEMGFYKLEVKEKFNLEIKLASLDEEMKSLRKLRDKFNSENLAIINTELKAANENFKKQNEHLHSTIEKLENDSKKYIKLVDERDHKVKDLQGTLLKLEAKNRELGNVKDTLEEQVSEYGKKNDELESTIEVLKSKSRKEAKALKKEITISKEENQVLLDRNDKLKVELDKLIQNLRRTHTSGVEYHTNTDNTESKQEKIILETLIFKNRELENELKGFRRENGKIKLLTDSLNEKLDAKQSALEEAVNFIYSERYLRESGVNKKDFNERDLKRIENAKVNKSLEEMRDLLGKLLTDNIKLKKTVDKTN